MYNNNNNQKNKMKYKDQVSREVDAAINILVTMMKLVERKQITDVEAMNKMNEILKKLEFIDEAIKLN
jgi:translation initiation factor 1 (eIF-1/SUI1)